MTRHLLIWLDDVTCGAVLWPVCNARMCVVPPRLTHELLRRVWCNMSVLCALCAVLYAVAGTVTATLWPCLPAQMMRGIDNRSVCKASMQAGLKGLSQQGFLQEAPPGLFILPCTCLRVFCTSSAAWHQQLYIPHVFCFDEKCLQLRVVVMLQQYRCNCEW